MLQPASNAAALDSLCRHEDHPILEQRWLPFLHSRQQVSVIGYVEGTYSAESLLDLVWFPLQYRHCGEEASDQTRRSNELVGADLWHALIRGNRSDLATNGPYTRNGRECSTSELNAL